MENWMSKDIGKWSGPELLLGMEERKGLAKELNAVAFLVDNRRLTGSVVPT